MTRTRTPVGLFVTVLLAAPVHAQQLLPAAGGAGPRMQPQVSTSPYQQPAEAPAAWGINPFAAPFAYPTYRPPARFAARPAAPPAAFAPAPPPANNPAAFNRGVFPPFPGAIPPAAGVVLVPPPGVAFNPVFVRRPRVSSAYYFPPIAARQPGASPPGEDGWRAPPVLGADLVPATGGGASPPVSFPDPGIVFPVDGFRFLPWA